MGPIPPVAFKENDIPRYEDDLIATDEIFRENINLEIEDDIIDDTNLQDDDNSNNTPNNTPNNAPNNDDYGESNESENDRPLSSAMLFTPTLEYLKNVLYAALNQFFDEFEIAVVSCPCLTKSPYNLAAAGLSGNTGILQLGDFNNFCPFPRKNLTFDIQHILSKYYDDIFVIGSGFAAKPYMPYNGHLTINAVVSANPTNVINNSCIAYEDNTDERRLEIINDPNEIKCSIFGNFFFSEGKRGMVIKMRAKGRRFCNIITLIQRALNDRFQLHRIGLGVILVINGGLTEQFIISENYPEYYFHTCTDYYIWLKSYREYCINLIALGTLINTPTSWTNLNGRLILDSRYKFNTFSNYESVGEFFDDTTPNETEYIAYLNIAQEYISKDDIYFS